METVNLNNEMARLYDEMLQINGSCIAVRDFSERATSSGRMLIGTIDFIVSPHMTRDDIQAEINALNDMGTFGFWSSEVIFDNLFTCTHDGQDIAVYNYTVENWDNIPEIEEDWAYA